MPYKRASALSFYALTYGALALVRAPLGSNRVRIKQRRRGPKLQHTVLYHTTLYYTILYHSLRYYNHNIPCYVMCYYKLCCYCLLRVFIAYVYLLCLLRSLFAMLHCECILSRAPSAARPGSCAGRPANRGRTGVEVAVASSSYHYCHY